jgi:hypothetical protein
MFDLAFLVGLPALAARTVVSVVDSACEYAVGAQEQSKAVVWTVEILGKNVKIHTDEDYDDFQYLFRCCKYPFEEAGVHDSTGGEGKYLVLWCLLRWACEGDDMQGLANVMRKTHPEQAATLRDALRHMTYPAKDAALRVSRVIIAQGAVPPKTY